MALGRLATQVRCSWLPRRPTQRPYPGAWPVLRDFGPRRSSARRSRRSARLTRRHRDVRRSGRGRSLGNWSISGSPASVWMPVTTEPAPKVSDTVLDDDSRDATGCQTSSCTGPVLRISSGAYADVRGATVTDANNSVARRGAMQSYGHLTVSGSTFSTNGANGAGRSSAPAQLRSWRLLSRPIRPKLAAAPSYASLMGSTSTFSGNTDSVGRGGHYNNSAVVRRAEHRHEQLRLQGDFGAEALEYREPLAGESTNSFSPARCS